ncbi:MAG: hypothetical protein HYU48_02525 [Candidatus Levybacteria bacterium]|nr:hypothetical protein [Candidatus Levybacteria bacterium]
MNKNVSIETLKALFRTHKSYLVPVLMVVVSVSLFFFALIPQSQDLMATLGKRSAEEQKLRTLKNNLNLLSTTNETELDLKLSTALKALPQDKDFESVLTTISSVADTSAVGLSNFELKVGDLASETSGNNILPSIEATIILNGGASGVSRFMTELAQSLPISEVKKVDVNVDFATILVAFYYKSLSSANISTDAKIMPLSAEQVQLLDKLSLSSSTTPF